MAKTGIFSLFWTAAGLLTAVGFGTPLLDAQFSFDVDHMPVQIHSLGSQGFAYSNDNNYLSMKTSNGSFAFTDAGANISTQLTDKLRIGAQIYLRNVGELGGWHPVLDWALADYKFMEWFGVRGGRVKTTLGLFNDTQDNEFLHTWVLLPQSVYPLDVRGNDIAHDGGDIYGAIPLKRLGHFDYTIYGGARAFDPYGGYPLALKDYGLRMQSQTGTVIGEDLRWTTPLQGLLIGATHAGYNYHGVAEGMANSAVPGFSEGKSNKNYTDAFYFDYSAGKLRLYGEYQRYWEDLSIFVGSREMPNYGFAVVKDDRSWYTAISYRISKRLEIGTYHSRFYGNWNRPHSSPDNHLFDQVVTARIDLNSHWDVKVEGHFMDGAPTGFVGTLLRGFYLGVNPNGFQPATNLLVIRTGFAF